MLSSFRNDPQKHKTLTRNFQIDQRLRAWGPSIKYPLVLCDHFGREFQGICQLLLSKPIATTSGFPGIHIWNGDKERGVRYA